MILYKDHTLLPNSYQRADSRWVRRVLIGLPRETLHEGESPIKILTWHDHEQATEGEANASALERGKEWVDGHPLTPGLIEAARVHARGAEAGRRKRMASLTPEQRKARARAAAKARWAKARAKKKKP